MTHHEIDSNPSSEVPGASGDPEFFDSDETPFSSLSPDRVLDALESIGLRADGRMLALNSFENRVYQLGVDGQTYVIAKFYRPHRWSDAALHEEHAFLRELADEEIPAVAPSEIGGATLHHFEGFRFAVFERRGGRTPEFEDRPTREWLGRFIGRIHTVGARADYRARPQLNRQTFGVSSRDYLLTHDLVPRDLVDAYAQTVTHALDGVERCYERAGEIRLLRLHGDCHAGNVLWTDQGPHFVDFDDSRMGPAIQDLWMLLPGDLGGQREAIADILAGYEDFREFNPHECHLIEALRTLRLVHYSAWLAHRWRDPAFPAAFPWFNTQRYWEERIVEMREQIAAMAAAPKWPGA